MDVPRPTRFADTEMVDGFEAEAHDLLVHILRLSPDEVFISDESALSDFSGCGLPDDVEYASPDEEHRAWKTWVLERIEACYGVRPLTPTCSWLNCSRISDRYACGRVTKVASVRSGNHRPATRPPGFQILAGPG